MAHLAAHGQRAALHLDLLGARLHLGAKCALYTVARDQHHVARITRPHLVRVRVRVRVRFRVRVRGRVRGCNMVPAHTLKASSASPAVSMHGVATSTQAPGAWRVALEGSGAT